MEKGQTPPSFWAKPTALYPVIDPRPPPTKVVRNIFGDLRRLPFITQFSGGIGYLCGIRAGLRLQSMMIGVASGLTLGLIDAFDSSRSRLTGFRPNDDFTSDGKSQYSFTKVVGNFILRDYLNITVLTGAFAAYEY